MRKATGGAIALAIFALSTGSPIREIPALHRVLGLGLLGGYLLLSFDPPTSDPRFRKFLLAGIAASVLSFLIAFAPLPAAVNFTARLLAIASIALPLWLVAGPARYGFVVAGAFALFTGIPAIADAGLYATSIHAYIAMASAGVVAGLIHQPSLLPPRDKRAPRLVVASNIVTMSPQQKNSALARIEKRFKDGEIPEHQYWDLRQELESR